MSRKNILISSALGLASFIVYLFTMPASVYTGDSGEIATAVYVWGVAHPTGFPVYMILAKLFSYLLPTCLAENCLAGGGLEFAHALNIFSALASAATVGILFLILQKLKINYCLPAEISGATKPKLALLNRLKAVPKGQFNRAGGGFSAVREAGAGIAASFAFAFGYTAWSHATTIQVYGLMALFFALAILVLLHWLKTQKTRWLYVLAVMSGLGIGTHPTFLLFFPFAIIYYLFSPQSRPILKIKHLFFCFLVLLFFSFLVYSYIPWRAGANPELNWGDPSNAKRFINYITQGDYADKIGTRSFESWKLMLSELGRIFSREFTRVGIMAVLIGMVIAFRKQKNFFYAGLSVIILNIILMGNYGNEKDIFILYRYFLPSFIIMAIFIGIALGTIASPFVKGGLRGILVLIFPAIIFAAHFSDLNRRDYKLLQIVTQDILDSVPQNSILISSGDTITGAFMYEQKVLGKRNDLVIIDDKLYTQPWYLAAKKIEAAAKNFVYKDNLSYLVKENLGRGVYSVSNAISFLKINFDFLPEGLVYKLYGKQDSINFEDFKNKNFSAWEKYDILYLQDKSLDDEYFNKELVNFYTGALNNFGAYLVNHSAVRDGILYFQKSLDIRENKNALYNLAGIYNALGYKEKALEYKARFDRAVKF